MKNPLMLLTVVLVMVFLTYFAVNYDARFSLR